MRNSNCGEFVEAFKNVDMKINENKSHFKYVDTTIIFDNNMIGDKTESRIKIVATMPYRI